MCHLREHMFVVGCAEASQKNTCCCQAAYLWYTCCCVCMQTCVCVCSHCSYNQLAADPGRLAVELANDYFPYIEPKACRFFHELTPQRALKPLELNVHVYVA